MDTQRFLLTASFYPPYHLGGDANHVRYLAEALSAQGHEVHVEYAPAALALKRSRPILDEEETDSGVIRHPIPATTGRLQPLSAWVLGAPPSVRRHHQKLVNSVRPHVIHYHNLSLLGLDLVSVPAKSLKLYTAHDYWVRCPRNDLFKYGRRLCERPTCFTCLTVSGKPPQLWRYFADAMRPFDALDAAIAPSAFLQRMIAPYLRAPVVHIPNFAPDPNPSGLSSSPGDYYLYVGRLERYKGIPELAGAALQYDGPHRFVVVGRGKQAGVLEAAQQKTDRLVVHGWLSAEERDQVYARARALLLPSIWYENAPLVAFEALAWGTPLLCSEIGALPEIVHDGLCGRTIAPTADGIVEGIERFEAAGLPQSQRSAARTAFETYHTTTKYLEQLHRLLEASWERRTDARRTRPAPVLSMRAKERPAA
ncbi:MAG: glycosyltransferase [Methanobacteriota archaeon]|nr:MAG: glycosyltransferase [Euryarchaeota archaeon]